MKRRLRLRVLFAAITTLAALLAVEIALRLLVQPSDRSYGVLLGQELPPLTLIPGPTGPPESDRTDWVEGLVVDGRRVSVGDLWGFQREDPDLGYAPKEDMVSVNGWWQSNNIGARERLDTPPRRPDGKRRALVFGDSYAQGSRVKQEESWPEVLERELDAFDVINLGADGYSMAQSFLRYRGLKHAIDHDLVLLVFVPIKDLWRDVNTIRSLAKDWDYYDVMPRFVVEQERLVLAPSPYETAAEVFEKNRVGAGPELKAHLEHHDRFYFEAEFRRPGLLGRSVLYKIGLRAYLLYRKRQLYGQLDPDSEAVEVTRRIFRSMHEEVEQQGGRFVLVFLPSHRDMESLRTSRRYAANWERVITAACGGDFPCIDLSHGFLAAPPNRLDRGYDGSHYGTQANRLIAELIRQRLSDLDLADAARSGRTGHVVGD
jgi:hypothetical protein